MAIWRNFPPRKREIFLLCSLSPQAKVGKGLAGSKMSIRDSLWRRGPKEWPEKRKRKRKKVEEQRQGPAKVKRG